MQEKESKQLVTLPFDDDTLWNIISNPSDELIYVNVNESYANLNDSLLYYCSNLDLNCHFDFTGCSTEIKFAVIDQYLNMHKLCTNEQLAATIASIFLRAKNIAYIDQSFLTPDEVDHYINTHIEDIDRDITFLDSVLVYMIFQLPSSHDLFDYSQLPIVNDKRIPVNLVNVFKIQEFCVFYTVLDETRFKWYEYQFKNPIYDNKDLSEYVLNENNIVAAWIYNRTNK